MEEQNRTRQLHKKERLANMELLRILAMMMVVMLHFLSKGDLLPPWTEPMNGTGYAAWILESFSIVAVNVYMLISGYFLIESDFKCKRLLQLILQTVFYAALIPVGMMAAGLLSPSELTIYQLIQYIFPVQMVHYWFISAYVLMYLFSPFMKLAVKHMKKSQLQAALGLLLLVLAVSKSVIPARLELDQLGYDSVWFLCVYITAAYIRLYGIPFFNNKSKSLCIYLVAVVGIFLWSFGLGMFYRKVGIFEDFIGVTYDYNHVLNLLASVALFYVFWHVRIGEGTVSKWICRMAPYTLGVYLLHEHIEVRYLWPKWLGAGTVSNPWALVLQSIGCVLLVFAIGIVTDAIRGWLFRRIGTWLSGSKADRLLQKLDNHINGRTVD